MRILITGICGFVGGALARELPQIMESLEILGLDNLSRPGSESNRGEVQRGSLRFVHGDIRCSSDLEELPPVDWVIDAAANPSVLAGISGAASSRQLMEHNLLGTLNLLEYCKRHHAGFVLLSTSRVYSCEALSRLPVVVEDNAFRPLIQASSQSGITQRGVSEVFSTAPPLSLYGAAKLASEVLALEYARTFDFPVNVNRCGVLAGAGQFGKPDQGILSYWVHSCRWKRPLRYIGFGGSGHQVRDFLHPRDLALLLAAQMSKPNSGRSPLNVSGGVRRALSLRQISAWCDARFTKHPVESEPRERPYDVPWLVLDSSRAEQLWAWKPQVSLEHTLQEIAAHAEHRPDWLDLSGGA